MQIKLSLMLLVFFFSQITSAEILSTSANHFEIKHVFATNVSAQKIYDAIAKNINQWWNIDHSYSGKRENLSIEAKAGGCFCEKLANGGGVKHMEIIYLEPNKTIRMQGGLGPLQSMAVNGVMTWSITKQDDVNRMELNYVVAGYYKNGLAVLAEPVNGVLKDQLERLRLFVEGSQNL